MLGLSLFGLPMLAGCAVIHRPPTTLPQIALDADAAVRTERATRDSVIARLVRRAVVRGDGTLDVLMLSGGGQNGAFGTGFLRGWQSRPDAPMPAFDLVTGISTGALQAPYVMLGTAAAMDTLTELYLHAEERVAPSIDWFSLVRRTGGLVNTARFDRALAESVSGPFRDNLRRAFDADRQIVVGTTDFDLGTGRTWSLSDALDTTTAGLTRTRQLLKAATAIPGIFPPVVIDGHVHGDGGVITNVLPLLDFADYQRLAAALAARGLRDVTVRVYVIMNLMAYPALRVVDPASIKQIVARTNVLLFYAHQPQTLELLDLLSRAVSHGVPGLRVEFHVATMPADLWNVPGSSALFNGAFSKHIDALGFAKARSATPWDSIPSAFQRPPDPKR